MSAVLPARLGRITVSVGAIVALVSVILALAILSLLFTDPAGFAGAVSDRDVTRLALAMLRLLDRAALTVARWL